MSSDALLIFLILAGLFTAYELAAIKLSWFPHTISWYSKRFKGLYYFVLALFLVGGVMGAVWWVHHIQRDVITR